MPKAASKYNISKHTGGGYRAKFTLDGKTVYIYGKTRGEVQTKLKAKLYAVEKDYKTIPPDFFQIGGIFF